MGVVSLPLLTAKIPEQNVLQNVKLKRESNSIHRKHECLGTDRELLLTNTLDLDKKFILTPLPYYPQITYTYYQRDENLFETTN